MTPTKVLYASVIKKLTTEIIGLGKLNAQKVVMCNAGGGTPL